MTPPFRALTVAIHPTARGFGWCVFESPFAPYDWGVYSPGAGGEARKNARCLARVARIIDRLTPETLVLERFDGEGAIRSVRIRKLCAAIVALARDKAADVAIYSRKDIERCFAHAQAKTRDEIAEVIARHVPALRHRLPARRRPWQSEDKRLALFCAAALVTTYYANCADRFLNDQRTA